MTESLESITMDTPPVIAVATNKYGYTPTKRWILAADQVIPNTSTGLFGFTVPLRLSFVPADPGYDPNGFFSEETATFLGKTYTKVNFSGLLNTSATGLFLITARMTVYPDNPVQTSLAGLTIAVSADLNTQFDTWNMMAPKILSQSGAFPTGTSLAWNGIVSAHSSFYVLLSALDSSSGITVVGNGVDYGSNNYIQATYLGRRDGPGQTDPYYASASLARA